MKKVTCNLCGMDNTKFLFKSKDRLHKVDEQEFNLVKCFNCGLVYINPQPEPSELAKYYPEDYGPYDKMNIFKIGRFGKLIKNIRDYFLKKNIREKIVLDDSQKIYFDFGCGGGENMLNIKKKHPNWKIEGADISYFACEKARKLGFDVQNGCIEDLQLKKEYYDVINVSHVIEHLNDPLNALKILKNSLKSGGKIIISTPNVDSFAFKIFRSYWYATDTPRHLYLFSKETLSNLLKKIEFKIEKVDYNTGPKVAIKSIYYIIGKKDLQINHFFWRIMTPFSKLASFWEANSIMTIEATK